MHKDIAAMSRTLDPSKASTPQRDYPTMILFGLIVLATIVGLPMYAYFYDFTWVDWTMFFTLYMVTGLGITVGYHRLITHRSFKCPDWVRFAFLIAGGMALENSALRWAGDHIRHHARCDQPEDPYNATLGFWHSHCGWIFWKDPNRDPKYATRLLQDPLIMWQNQHYLPIVLTGLFIPFV
ncbi:MAG: acyl-CoA desaturase, partial [Nitrospirota bacterium]|nr:acyl-CoA desaturase [Nitrospirota bacterium]